MPLYEHTMLARQDLSEKQVEIIINDATGTLEANAGSVVNSEYWGPKTLAYRIKRNRKAHYAFLNIDAPPSAIAEMERQLRLNEDILRFLTLRVDSHSNITPMMQKRQRSDRRRQEEQQEKTV